jgi:exosome complex RNA-binding protein Rrp42 (RNase PH superfamily)
VLSSRLYQVIIKYARDSSVVAKSNEIVSRSGIIPLESLCIQPGKAVWVLYIDAICINYDGNAFDATLLAVQAALNNSNRLLHAASDLTSHPS